jgi:hypothetical protein
MSSVSGGVDPPGFDIGVFMIEIQEILSDASNKYTKLQVSTMTNRFMKLQTQITMRDVEIASLRATNNVLERIQSTNTDKLDAILSSIVSLPAAPTYASVAQTAPIPLPRQLKHVKEQHVLLVYPKNKEANSEVLKAALMKAVNPRTLQIGVRNVRKIREGGIAIEVDSNDEVDKLKTAIENTVTDIKSVDRPKPRHPQMLLKNVPRDIEQIDVIQNLFDQNHLISDNYNTIEEFSEEITLRFHFGKQGSQSTNWVIEVSPALRNLILPQGKLNMNWVVCHVVDHCIVNQCFRCLEYGHTKKFCKSKLACSHCTDEHSYKDCPVKTTTKPICVTCSKRKLKCDHSSNDKKCPEHIRQTRITLQRINYV